MSLPTRKLAVFSVLSALSMGAMFLVARLSQSEGYHHFADSRSFFGVPNFLNVASNAVFILVGIVGLGSMKSRPIGGEMKTIYTLLFGGIVLVGLASGYYHWRPNDNTLVWDRLPMTIVFMSLFAATVSELISKRLGFGLLFPLILVGIGSVWWWHYTESAGHGDLRPYIWVQFYPVLFIPLLLVLYHRQVSRSVVLCLCWVVAWYGIAKVFEALDWRIYKAISISGHTLKHLAASVSCWYLVLLFRIKYRVTKKGDVTSQER